MARKKAAVDHRDHLSGITLSTQGMAAHLGITTRWLQILVKDGTIPALGRGRFDPTAATLAYLSFLKDSTEKKTGSTSMDVLREEKTKEIRMNRARRERELIPLDEALAAHQELCGFFTAYLSGLPAEITGVPRERQRLKDIIDAGKQRLADRLEERLAAVRNGDTPSDAEADD